MSLRYLSVCAGIEAASVAWAPLGFEPVAFSEIDAFPCAVLAHHYPSVPNWGDMTRFQEWPSACVCVRPWAERPAEGDRADFLRMRAASDSGAPTRNRGGSSRGGVCEQCGGAVIDLLVGGTPCQSFSVAGLRAGLDDPRGSLMLTYLALARRYRPRWVVWENVPGVLSSGNGRDFGTFLGGLADLGYGFAYRVLNAQYFGLAQRRKRVFVVGHLGDWRRAAAVLFERHSLSGHPAPRREAGQDAPTVPARRTGSGGLGTDWDCDGGLIAAEIAATLETTCHDYSRADGFTMIAHSLRADGFDASEDGTGRGTPLVPVAFDTYNQQITGDTAQTLCSRGDTPGGNSHLVPAVVFGSQMSTPHWQHDLCDTLQAKNPKALATGMAVRRLTPRECERLQGFPDDYTLIPYRGKPAADGPRYKALGNSMAVPVVSWIGRRIQEVDAL